MTFLVDNEAYIFELIEGTNLSKKHLHTMPVFLITNDS